MHEHKHWTFDAVAFRSLATGDTAIIGMRPGTLFSREYETSIMQLREPSCPGLWGWRDSGSLLAVTLNSATAVRWQGEWVRLSNADALALIEGTLPWEVG